MRVLGHCTAHDRYTLRCVECAVAEDDLARATGVGTMYVLTQRLEGAVETLRELVRLKDGPRDDAYRAAKDAAWDAAREVLGWQSETALGTDELQAPDGNDG